MTTGHLTVSYVTVKAWRQGLTPISAQAALDHHSYPHNDVHPQPGQSDQVLSHEPKIKGPTVKMLRDHLGHDALASEPTYMAFEKAFRTLAREVDLGSDTHQLDRYLWIVGEYREWLKNPKSVYSELRRQVFETDPQPPELKDAAGEWYTPRDVNLKRPSRNR